MRIKAYHGTNVRFSKFDETKARIANDFYGGGVAYFTDKIDVAKSYASAMFRTKGGERYVYEVDLSLDRIFDVDDKFTGNKLAALVGKEVEQFARAARLLPLGSDRIKVISSLKEGAMTLNGDTVFRGMSNGMKDTATARKKLIALGYDGLRYNGGDMMLKEKHNVYLAYRASSISIKHRYIMSNKPIQPAEQKEVYTFI